MCYFRNAIQNPQMTIDSICFALKDPKLGNVDYIVGMGMSGILILVPVSMQSGIPCVAVRKQVEMDEDPSDRGCHGNKVVERSHSNYTPTNRYVIIDDFIESGNTIGRIRKIMSQQYQDSKCADVILYQDNGYISSLDIPVLNVDSAIANLKRNINRQTRLQSIR